MAQQMNKQKQKNLLTEIMNDDAKDGLYDTTQTAVEWLFEQYKKHGILFSQDEEQAKEMDKEQKKQFWIDGNNTQRCNSTKEINECFEQYYNETYGKQ